MINPIKTESIYSGASSDIQSSTIFTSRTGEELCGIVVEDDSSGTNYFIKWYVLSSSGAAYIPDADVEVPGWTQLYAFRYRDRDYLIGVTDTDLYVEEVLQPGTMRQFGSRQTFEREDSVQVLSNCIVILGNSSPVVRVFTKTDSVSELYSTTIEAPPDPVLIGGTRELLLIPG
jgi:hypothetical protein